MPRPVHFEILSKDPEKTAQFYHNVFGWEIASWSGPQAYWMTTTGKDEPGIDGGFMHDHFPQPVINTIQVDDLEATMAKCDAAGGEKVHGPDEIPGVGTHVYYKDSAGVIFGMMQPAAS